MSPVRGTHDSTANGEIRQDDAVGISSQAYAEKVKLLIGLMTDLRAMGAQTDIDLPRIAVIGNQSAGKSSLVEAISGISVPRAAGTCTRCPMECRMTNSESPWCAQVLLRRERDETGARLNKIQEIPFGPLLDDKGDLEEMLRRAQLAILNPSLPASYFEDLEASDFEESGPPPGTPRQLQFSPNLVCVDIAGPDLTNLSFIDLPGIISNVADGEDRNNIDLVKSLVSDHIGGNALILLTITMRDDIENQSAAFLAKEADRNGLRTIGVLTKPDLLQQGEEKSWLAVLEGRRHPLHHGYFVTKQPALSELDERVEHHVAREREQIFFTKQAPWNSVSLAIQNRMGVPKLTRELSKLLSQLIEQLLPQLRAETQNSLLETTRSLNALPPPPPTNPAAEVLRMVTAFASEFDCFVKGNEAFESLLQQCRPAYKQFKRDISSTAPNFQPFLSQDQDVNVVVDSDSEHLPEAVLEQEPMYIDQIREHIEKSLTRQLPYNLPFSAKVGLIQNFFRTWPLQAMNCFDSVCGVVQRQLNELIDKYFERFEAGQLKERVHMIVEGLVEKAARTTKDRIEWILKLEDPPFTLNDHYFSSYREKYLAKFKRMRRGPDADIDEELAGKALEQLAGLNLPNLTVHDLYRLRSDPYEHELITMAEVRAYFQVSYKRVIDNIPRIIDYDFLRTLGNNMQDALVEQLELVGPEASKRATTYLREDPNITMEREALLQKKKRLEEIKQKLFAFHAS